MTRPLDVRVWAITGVPGSGKSTLARALAERAERTVVSTHELVAAVDPATFAEGRMADAERLARAYALAVEPLSGPYIVDGWPRSEAQLDMLPEDSLVFRLWCPRHISMERLLNRGRADDTPGIIGKRWDEQDRLLSADWLKAATTHTRQLNTDRRTAASVLATVWEYMTGRKREVY